MGKRVKVPVPCPSYYVRLGRCKEGEFYRWSSEQQLLAIGGPLHGQEVNWSAIPEQEQNNYIRFNAASGLRGLKRGERYYPKAVWLYGPEFKEWSDDADSSTTFEHRRFCVRDTRRDGGVPLEHLRERPGTAVADATGTPYGEGICNCGVSHVFDPILRGPGW